MAVYSSGTALTGIPGTNNFDSTGNNLLVDSFSKMLIQLNPNGSAPLFALLDAIYETETALQPVHSFFTKKLVFPEMKLTAALAASAADSVDTASVVSTANVVPGQVYSIESTSEQVLVTEVVSSTSVKLRRGFGSTAPAASTASDNLVQVGNAFEEASVRPQAMAMNVTEVTNNTQIFRNTWAVPGSLAASQLKVGGGAVARSRQEAAWFHAMDIERALFFSEKTSKMQNNQPIRTMRGLYAALEEFASGNITTMGATTNFDQLETAIDPCFDTVTDPSFAGERVIFCGGQARKVINKIGMNTGQYQLIDGQTSFGLRFETFKLTRGTLNLIEHPLFNTNATWQKMAIVVDMSSLSIAYLDGRRTLHHPFNSGVNNDGRQAVDNGIDAEGGTLTTECTLVCKNPAANAILLNLTAAA